MKRVTDHIPDQEKNPLQSNIARFTHKSISIKDGEDVRNFHFDRIFESGDVQEEVFEFARHVVEDALKGIDGLILIHGEGPEGVGSNDYSIGFLPRIVEGIFQLADASTQCTMSTVDVDTDKIKNLLDCTNHVHFKEKDRELIIIKEETPIINVKSALYHLKVGLANRTESSWKTHWFCAFSILKKCGDEEVNSLESGLERQEVTLNKDLYNKSKVQRQISRKIARKLVQVKRNTALKTEFQGVKSKQIRAEEETKMMKLQLEEINKLLLAKNKEEERYKENKDKEEKDKEKEKTEKNKFLSLFMSIIVAVSASFTISSKFQHVSAGMHVSIAVFGALSFAFSSVGLIIASYGWGRLSSIKLAFWVSFCFLTIYSCLGMASASKEAEKDNSVFWAIVTTFLCVTIIVMIYAIWGVNFEGWVKSKAGNVKDLFSLSVKSKVVHPSSSTSPKKLDSPSKDLELTIHE